ncbi:MAG: hypothetical protein LBP28_09100 [Coriobacteriales bacterium]|jgi:exopolyphosphatase/guanosine-5'-triphosphate,3'-diphosphate pyrophosphatase|nr:hypothetical protein [Coriobacteriales bacterium]
MIRAAIDLGTVTSRLLVADVGASAGASGLKELRREIRITDMGEGLAGSGVISVAAIARVAAALRAFLEVIAAVRAEQLSLGADCSHLAARAIATSALRDALNRTEVAEELAGVGVEIEIISGQREAWLTFLGTLSGFAPDGASVLTVDVGGGSTELVYGRADWPPVALAAHSLNIGARRVTDLFLHSDPPTATELTQARTWVQEQVVPVLEALEAIPERLCAVAGSATSAIAIREQLDPYDPTRVHGAKLAADELEALITRLATLPLKQRQQVVGLKPARARVIVGGLLCLHEVLAATTLTTLTVSETDILQGILLDSTLQEQPPTQP